jgi:uncharacterized RDD family membrane protein YckC
MEGEDGQQERRWSKANVLHRFIAKFIDFLIIAACSKLIPPIGFFGGIAYLLIADGFWEGQSVGKRLIGLQTMKAAGNGTGSFKESILRNAPLAAGWVIGLIPYVGWLLFGAVVVLEALLVIGNDRGMRIGDEIAQTQVIDRVPVSQTAT